MLREMRVKNGRARVVPFLRTIAKLKLVDELSINLAILQVVFSEMQISAKKAKK